MSCIICKTTEEPWLLLKNDHLYVNEECENIGQTIQTCSYLCTRQCQKHIPRNYSRYVLNKDDFCYLRPIISKKEEKFEILTFDEIHNMTDYEKEIYYSEKERYMGLDIQKLELYEEIENEDMNTFLIENEEYLSGDEKSDDY